MGYIQFEGIDDYTEVELGRTVVLMSNYHGEVPEGKKFAGWTLDGNTVYAPGAEFTFSKDLAVDLGVIRQIKRCLFRQIKTGLSERYTMV